MSKVVGDIAIKVGADTTSLTTGMSGATASLAKFAKIGGAAVAAVGAAMVALTKQSMANIDALTKQARSIGLTTSAFQKMTMVAEEAGVGADKLASSLGLMQRNIDELRQGTKLQTDAFAALGLSFADLEGQTPDEQFAKLAEALDSIEDPAQKTALAMETLGRGGRDVINMLSGYTEKVAEAEAFQLRFGVAVSQTAAEDIEAANDAVGRLGMVMQGLGNKMAAVAAGPIEAAANAIVRFAGAVTGAKVELEEFFGTLDEARASLGEDIFNKLLGNPAAIREHADAIEAVVAEMDAINTIAAVASPQLRIFADELDDIGEEGHAEVMRSLAWAIDNVRDEYKSGAIDAEEFRLRMVALADESRTVVSELSAIDGVNFTTAFKNIEGLASRLWEAAKAANAARNAMPGSATGMTTGTSISSTDGDLLPPNPNAPNSSPRPQRPGIDSQANWASHGSSGSGGGGGGGGGGAVDPNIARLESLIQSLKTEEEIITEWYGKSLELLNNATEAELEALGGKHAAMERLEEEHQERLGRIKELGNQWGVQAALDGGAEILGAMASTNKKAAKLQGIFAAGSALMSTYQGAAKELEKGTFGFASAAAVIAKGLGFITAIKSASTSASSGAMPSASTGGATAAPAATPLQVDVNTFGGGDLISMMDFGKVLDMLNDAAGDRGYVLNTRPA